jgi:hypothetical protein
MRRSVIWFVLAGAWSFDGILALFRRNFLQAGLACLFACCFLAAGLFFRKREQRRLVKREPYL